MALNFNGTEPTKIMASVNNQYQSYSFAFPAIHKPSTDIGGAWTADEIAIIELPSPRVFVEAKINNIVARPNQYTTVFDSNGERCEILINDGKMKLIHTMTQLSSGTINIAQRTIAGNIKEGTDLLILKSGTTAVWGKPYTLSISQGANTSITVNRTSSPNRHASTGNLTSGSLVYYGDVLKISAAADSGFLIDSFTVNGGAWTSGNSVTVTGAIRVVTTSKVSKQWRVVWSGNQKVNGTVSYSDSPNFRDNVKTRITGEVTASYFNPNNLADRASGSESFTNEEIMKNTETFLAKATALDKRGNSKGTASGYAKIGNSSKTIVYRVSSTITGGLKITKVEQYY